MSTLGSGAGAPPPEQPTRRPARVSGCLGHQGLLSEEQEPWLLGNALRTPRATFCTHRRALNVQRADKKGGGEWWVRGLPQKGEGPRQSEQQKGALQHAPQSPEGSAGWT